jgi:hypothetical protein
VDAGSPENLSRRQILTFDPKDAAGTGMYGVPGNPEMDTFQAIRGAGTGPAIIAMHTMQGITEKTS